MKKSGFLLIELLIAFSIFVLGVLAISRLQLQAIKTRRAAIKRMHTITNITDARESVQIEKKEAIWGQNAYV